MKNGNKPNPFLVKAYERANKKQRRWLYFLTNGQWDQLSLSQLNQVEETFGGYSDQVNDQLEEARLYIEERNDR